MLNPKGMKNVELFSQGTVDSQNLRYKTLATADYEHVSILSFSVLDLKFLMEEDDDLHTDCL